MEITASQWFKYAQKFQVFLPPLVRNMGRSERRESAALYVQGLILQGQRKSIEPMAERLEVDPQKLQQFISDSPWDDQAVWKAIRKEVASHLEPPIAIIVDETGWIKQGKHSVGVGHQYCGAVGKSANCQVNVQIAVTDGIIAAPIAARLYLPEKWTQDRQRCRDAGVPDEIKFATKPQIASILIEEIVREGIAEAPVLADTAYGNNGAFREDLRRMGLEFCLQINAKLLTGWLEPVKVEKKKVYWGVCKGQPPAKPLHLLFTEQKIIAWHKCSWKSSDRVTRHTRLAWQKIWLPGAWEKGVEKLEEVWLLVDWPEDSKEAYHFYLGHFHRQPTRSRLLQLSRSRWNIEQYFQRSKDDLGLDHFEGRGWRGFHHHLVMAVLAYLFVAIIYVRSKKNFWCDVGESTETDKTVADTVHRVLQLLQKKI